MCQCRASQMRCAWLLVGDNDLEHLLKCACLFPFLLCTQHPIISKVVVCNGIMCHGSAYVGSTLHPRFKAMDIAINACLVAYVNLTSVWYPHTHVISAFAIVMWALNNAYFHRSPLIHVLCVQLTLCTALAHF